MTVPENIGIILKSLPPRPGVYQFFDKDQKIIYVGKARNLKKRVTSYFGRDHADNGKIRLMVSRITDIRFIVVETETDAFLLENNLIKEYQPRYNVMLKDDKTFPWICIRNEPFPRVFPTRNVVRDGSQYFGPYASGKMMNTLLDLIRQLYPVRSCSLRLSPENISRARFKVCLQYHIGNCKGPCENLQTEDEYLQMISEIRQVIKGNLGAVETQLRELMFRYAEEMQFEKAQLVKEKLDLLEKYRSRSTIVNPSISNVDVFSIADDSRSAYVNYLKVIQGAIVQSHTIELRKRLDESQEELLSLAVVELRMRFESDAPEIILPFAIESAFGDVAVSIPKKGDKKKLLELSERNAHYCKQEKLRQLELTDPEKHVNRVLDLMQKDLHLSEPPAHIECFDNSNIQGQHAVAAMVVFKNARPDKKEYRHFNIKSVQGPDDYASMEEIIYRRYKRLLDENKALPQLIVIDGGKGQLGSALKSLEKLGLRGKIGLISIAKRLEEIYFPGDALPLYIDKKSETLKVLQHIRNEAHRFGITHHRKKREKETIKTALTGIDGIGETTARDLLKHFKSVKNVAAASLDELRQVVGKARGQIVFDYFRS